MSAEDKRHGSLAQAQERGTARDYLETDLDHVEAASKEKTRQVLARPVIPQFEHQLVASSTTEQPFNSASMRFDASSAAQEADRSRPVGGSVTFNSGVLYITQDPGRKNCIRTPVMFSAYALTWFSSQFLNMYILYVLYP